MKHVFAHCSRQGLTLVELLVAVAILVILIGVVYLVYGTALNTIRTQTARRESLEPAADALDMLQCDLMGSLALKGVTNPPFVLAPAGQDTPETFSLRLFTTWPGEGSNDWRMYGIREVEYALQADNAAGQSALVRRCRPFRVAPPTAGASLPTSQRVGPEIGTAPAPNAPPAEDTVLRPVAGIQILVYDGSAWTNAWGAGAASGALPQAARISLQIGDPSAPRTLNLETLIPAGHKIKHPPSG